MGYHVALFTFSHFDQRVTDRQTDTHTQTHATANMRLTNVACIKMNYPCQRVMRRVIRRAVMITV